MNTDEIRLLRVLAHGGMLLQSADGYRVCRTMDARRGCVGVLAFELVERLKAEGALVAQCALGQRWTWREGHALPAAARSSSTTPRAERKQMQAGRMRSASVLEAALKRDDDPRDRNRLARAAMRFLRDYETQSTSRSVTMNWSFELSGQTRGHRGASAGLPERSLSARAALGRIAEVLGPRQFALVESVLVKGHTQRRICADFGISTRRVHEALRQGLQQVAHTYDHYIRAEA